MITNTKQHKQTQNDTSKHLESVSQRWWRLARWIWRLGTARVNAGERPTELEGEPEEGGNRLGWREGLLVDREVGWKMEQQAGKVRQQLADTLRRVNGERGSTGSNVKGCGSVVGEGK